MAAKPGIAIVGPGNLGTALAVELRRAGFVIEAVIGRSPKSLRRARALAKRTGARAASNLLNVKAEVVWFCVPDSAIEPTARLLATQVDWKGRVALHSSGALSSDELDSLRRRGASVASAHPFMTFVRGSQPTLARVPFAIEGDASAVRVARRMVRDLGGQSYTIRTEHKAAYHAWGTFASPLLTALLATTEQVAAIAGVQRTVAVRRMMPILLQTLANYAAFGAPGAFSGPLVRGDAETVVRHLQVLTEVPAAREIYLSLGRAALKYLPTKNKSALKRLLDES
jgi:predicted short-subunit dehydrogenase-like oxidoreductase (DUF2520 family)